MKIAIFSNKNDVIFFIEYLDSIKKYIDYDLFLYKRAISITNLDQYDRLFFIQKMSNKLDISNLDPKKIYIINTEQYTRDSIFNSIKNQNNLIDYSFENIYLMNKNIMHFPYGINKKEIFNYIKNKNICFCGKLSERRKHIINELQKNKINVDIIYDFGEKRDKKLFCYKILLNIHCKDNYKIYESIRCDRCIFNKMIVITEKSLLDSENILKDKMIVCDYNNIVDTVIEVLNNYEHYYNKLFNDYDKFMDQHQNTIKKIYEENLKKLENNN